MLKSISPAQTLLMRRTVIHTWKRKLRLPTTMKEKLPFLHKILWKAMAVIVCLMEKVGPNRHCDLLTYVVQKFAVDAMLVLHHPYRQKIPPL